MTENATKSYVDNSILKHEKDANVRMEKTRHTLRNDFQKCVYDLDTKMNHISDKVNDNKSNLILFKNSQENMEEHLKQWISDIKEIVEKSAETYPTKWELGMTNERQRFIIKIMYYAGGLISTAFIAFVTYVFNNWKI